MATSFGRFTLSSALFGSSICVVLGWVQPPKNRQTAATAANETFLKLMFCSFIG